MFRVINTILIGSLLPAVVAHAQSAPPLPLPTAPLILRGATVIDVRTGEQQIDRTVVVVGTRIQAIAPTDSARIPTGAQVVDARDKYLIPGLWDMHTRAFEARRLSEFRKSAEVTFGRLLLPEEGMP